MKDIKFIADIGSNHNGSLSRIDEMIYSLSQLGFWGVKFQVFNEKMYNDKALQKEVKKNILPLKFLPKISNLCAKYNIKLGATPFYNKAVSEIHPYVDFIKISSFDSERKILLDDCLNTNKQIMISFGLSNDDIIKNVYKKIFFNTNDKKHVFMHCVSNYPAKPKHASLQRIKHINNLVSNHYIPGYSDHTVNKDIILGSIINSAEYVELHYDLDDHKGNEYIYGHCWDTEKLTDLMNTINIIKDANSKEVIINNTYAKLKANENGVRDEK